VLELVSSEEFETLTAPQVYCLIADADFNGQFGTHSLNFLELRTDLTANLQHFSQRAKVVECFFWALRELPKNDRNEVKEMFLNIIAVMFSNTYMQSLKCDSEPSTVTMVNNVCLELAKSGHFDLAGKFYTTYLNLYWLYFFN
jgi:hypothetical protein